MDVDMVDLELDDGLFTSPSPLAHLAVASANDPDSTPPWSPEYSEKGELSGKAQSRASARSTAETTSSSKGKELTDEERAQRTKERNRIYAARTRQRKNRQTQELRERCAQLELENAQLQEVVRDLQQENARLRGRDPAAAATPAAQCSSAASDAAAAPAAGGGGSGATSAATHVTANVLRFTAAAPAVPPPPCFTAAAALTPEQLRALQAPPTQPGAAAAASAESARASPTPSLSGGAAAAVCESSRPQSDSVVVSTQPPRGKRRAASPVPLSGRKHRRSTPLAPLVGCRAHTSLVGCPDAVRTPLTGPVLSVQA